MDNPEILQAVIAQLPLRDQLACTLVNRRWHRTANAQIDAHYLKKPDSAGLASQASTLRSIQLYKYTIHLLPEFRQLSRLETLSITTHIDVYDRSSATRSSHINNPLADLLVQLPLLAHLYINDRVVRTCGTHDFGQLPRNASLGRTDEALIALAKSRSDHGLPGLRSLSITASPYVSDHGIISYLTYQSPASSAQIAREHASCGYSLRDITLSSCPRLSSATLEAIAQSCPRLTACTLKNVDGIFEVEGQRQVIGLYSEAEILAELAQRCQALRRLEISLGPAKVPSFAFDTFRDHASLRLLSVTASKHFSPRHLFSFNTIQRLSISGCPALGADLPFASLPDLREFTYLGQGVNTRSLWKLLTHCKYLQRLSIDVADQWERSYQDIDHGFLAASQNAHATLTEALLPFSSINILSARLPSWALAYLLSFSPSTLEAVSLNGTSMEAGQNVYATVPAIRAWWMDQRKLAWRQYHGYSGHSSYIQAFLWLFGIRLPQSGPSSWSSLWTRIRKAFDHAENRPKRTDATGSAIAHHQTADVTFNSGMPSVALTRHLITSAAPSDSRGAGSPANSTPSSPADHAVLATRPQVGIPLDETSRHGPEAKLVDLLRLPAPAASGLDQAYAVRSKLSREQTEWLQCVTNYQFARLDV